MATFNYIQRGKTETIYCRLRHKNIDLNCSAQIYVNPKHWDKKYQKIKNVVAIQNRDEINTRLATLKIFALSKFNIDFTSGKIIDKQWLEKVIHEFYDRPINESTEMIYFADFIKWWLENQASNHRTTTGESISERGIFGYKQSLETLIEYEKHFKVKIKLQDTDKKLFDNIGDFLLNELDYAESTAKRHISRMKFFCARAEEDNIKINHGYKAKNYIKKHTPDYKEPYLNTDEIDMVFNYKTEKERLAWTRDNWIIGLWTGLRVSDFLTRLKIDDLNADGFIHIKGKKTGIPVAIPIHSQIKSILKKYEGLPPKVSEPEFNENIKIIAKDLGFNKKMMGGIAKVNNKGVIRKHIGLYEKWELTTSHICRRSFCTNLIGKVPNQVIMDVAGWKSLSQMLDYNKQTNLESAIKLKEYWEKEEI